MPAMASKAVPSAAHSATTAITAPIVGATKPQHLDDAIAAVDVKLSAEEIATLEEAYVPHAAASE